MADFENHCRFTLRCLSKDVIPVSVRLKSTIKTPKGRYIIRKAERALLNERVRSINNSLTMFKAQRDTCINNLETSIERDTMNDCYNFIKVRREGRHQKTLDRQISKFHRLCHKNNVYCPDFEHGEHGGHGCTSSKCPVLDNPTHGDEDNYKNDNQVQVEEESTKKWVRNISKTPLTKAQEKLLAHSPNFVIVPKEPPTTEYIVAIEKACLRLPSGKAEELRGEVKAILKKDNKNKPNITKEEYQAIKDLRRDKTRMVLTTDKGVSMVVMDKEDYNSKSEELLHTPTYQILKTDPTNKIKNKLISLLKTIKAEGGISETTYKKLYPTGDTTPKYYGLPKVHKEGTPLRPIVSSIGSATYETAKELSKILKPLVGRSIHHVKNNQEFIQSLQDITVDEEDCMMSFDVKSLFTSIPIQPTLTIIKKLLEEDTSLHQRTSMAVKHINWLLELCLTNTYFSFQGKLYEQKDGAAMGSPISPIAANIFMEDFENRALATSPCTPKIWKRFVDDAFTIIKKNQKQTFLEHLNSINNNIQFTSEDPGEDGSIPFLDMLIIPDGEGRLKTTVYRKPPHTNQYLHWDSHHDIPSKYSVIGTLFHRAKTICSEPKQLQEEEEHLYKSLKRCKYPTWALNRVKMRSQTTLHKKKKNSRNTNGNQEQKTHITVPYHQGLSESFKRTCKKYDIEVHLKGGHTIRNLLMNP